MKEKLSDAVTVLLVLCALVTTGTVVRREVAAHQAKRASTEGVEVERWDELTARPAFAGASDAAVTVAIFADYACRYCKRLEGQLEEVRGRFGRDVALVHQHFPVLGDASARAAVAAECAGRQGRFPQMHGLLYQNQARLDSARYDRLAAEAGVPDLPRFAACVASSEPAPRVREDTEWGERFGVVSTPTLVINGRLFRGALPPAQLASRIEKALREAGRRN